MLVFNGSLSGIYVVSKPATFNNRQFNDGVAASTLFLASLSHV
ncbi:hypothetical protein VCR5J5_250107 [Vibrio crassostreae]|uniref:Uncharacterized protein n=1 Tax=Vibrio crassostreae TaxID=246167 RepID=A0A822N198_9VIBR|nr:hypothetical protein VCR5J5_250107 [Vibrio crassostreae]CDT43560.1 hypothetical protein VCR9J2_700284 [Vibrio crassostreae]